MAFQRVEMMVLSAFVDDGHLGNGICNGLLAFEDVMVLSAFVDDVLLGNGICNGPLAI